MTASKRYFKHCAESDVGAVGTAYLEIADGWPSRQVEVYPTMSCWADEQHPDYLADQPLSVLELGEEHEISAAEFELAWASGGWGCQESGQDSAAFHGGTCGRCSLNSGRPPTWS